MANHFEHIVVFTTKGVDWLTGAYPVNYQDDGREWCIETEIAKCRERYYRVWGTSTIVTAEIENPDLAILSLRDTDTCEIHRILGKDEKTEPIYGLYLIRRVRGKGKHS